jgi:hypothetical protein
MLARSEVFGQRWDRHLRRDVAAVAGDLCTDVDQFLAQARERPLFNRFGYRERPQKVSKIVGERMRLKASGVGIERDTRKPRPFDRACVTKGSLV